MAYAQLERVMTYDRFDDFIDDRCKELLSYGDYPDRVVDGDRDISRDEINEIIYNSLIYHAWALLDCLPDIDRARREAIETINTPTTSETFSE